MRVKNKYTYLAILLMAGYILFSFPCLFKFITGHPCPACGTRRAVFAILQGHIYTSLLINPYGLLFVTISIVYLIGISFDFILGNRRFHSLLKKSEQFLANKYILLIIISLMIANWIWNIQKGL